MAERLAADPISFARRYREPADAEIAAIIAASFAFGRVSLFRPVVAKVLAEADRKGGPRAFVESFDPDRDGEALRPLFYRWLRGTDLILWLATLGAVLRTEVSLEALFRGWRSDHDDVEIALTQAIERLRTVALEEASRCGFRVARFDELPLGFRYLLPSPKSGSACKRWNMFLRWMIRSPADGVDLGLWRSIPPRALIIPLDTHVARISRLVGLTKRRDASWRTAVEITSALRALDPEDPVRFDFAIAHLGISGACIGRFDSQACPECPLEGVCGSRGVF